MDEERLVEALKAVADPTRLEICRRLSSEELCVCHLVDDLEMSQPLLSHHLKVLKEAGLIESRRFSYWTYHRLRPEPFTELSKEISEIASASRRVSARACC